MTHNPFLEEVAPLRGQDWRDRAICAQTDPELWFPDKGGSPRQAKQVCADCPVRWECLAHALSHNERWGVWGGFTVEERERMRAPKVAEPIPLRQRIPIDIGERTHGTHAGWNAGCQCRACEAAEKFYQRSRHVRRGSGGAA